MGCVNSVKRFKEGCKKGEVVILPTMYKYDVLILEHIMSLKFFETKIPNSIVLNTLIVYVNKEIT